MNSDSNGGTAMKGVGSSVVVVMLLLVGLGLTIGVLTSNTELVKPQEAAFNSYVANEKWRIEQQRAEDQRAFEQQQQAQALENQRLYGQALAWLIPNGGIVCICQSES